MEEICNLCLQRKELVNSHSIPDSLFRQIFRQGSGKAVALLVKKTLGIDFRKIAGATAYCVVAANKN